MKAEGGSLAAASTRRQPPSTPHFPPHGQFRNSVPLLACKQCRRQGVVHSLLASKQWHTL